MMCLRSRPLG